MRDASTYRGTRRNAARGKVWGPAFYYSGHRANYRRVTFLSRHPSRYHLNSEVAALAGPKTSDGRKRARNRVGFFKRLMGKGA